MSRAKEKKHPEYYAIKAYEILARKSEQECADKLGVTLRTYQDKKKGYSDFTPCEGSVLADFLNQPMELIFLT